MFLHDIEFDKFDIACEDTLTNPQHWDDEPFELIVSNPPYIPPSVIEGLMPEVRLHEPMLALDGGQDGLEFYRRIARQAVTRLAPNGRLFLEIGCEQAAAVAEILQKQGYREVQVFQDLAGKDRIVQCIV